MEKQKFTTLNNLLMDHFAKGYEIMSADGKAKVSMLGTDESGDAIFKIQEEGKPEVETRNFMHVKKLLTRKQ